MGLSDDSRESDSMFADEAGLIETSGSPNDEPGDGHSRKQRGKQSRLISKVLGPAIRLWLKSQLETVEDLQIEIEAGDRQLLSGGISQVFASAQKACYQGLHLSQATVVGQEIQTNLPQVLRGKPFRLLASFPVTGEVVLSEADLNASLQAPLLSKAVKDFLVDLLQPIAQRENASHQQDISVAPLQQAHIKLDGEEITFQADWLLPNERAMPLMIRTKLEIHGGNTLVLDPFQCWIDRDGIWAISPQIPNRFSFNLGSEVCLETLTLQTNQILCRGRITVIP